jgi:hypothetical protein
VNKFIRYNSLENYWYLEKIMEYCHSTIRTEPLYWHVTEKIHGSNVCISNMYKEGPAFFTRNGNQLPADYQEVLRKYDWEWLFKQYPGLKFVYGEIAGPKIQKGVDYGDERKLYIFDYSNGESYLRIPKQEEGFDYAPGFTIAPVSYNDFIEWIIDRLEHDPISTINPTKGNVIEGFVVKCVSMPMLTKETRFIFKVKHPRFEEKIKTKKEKKFDDTDYDLVDQYINENRVASAISKFPGYNKQQIGDVLREIVKDVEEDMKKDGHRWNKKYAKRITSFAQKTVVQGA